ncbi:MAG: sulfopyruvate decarboxylase subunit beta [Thaumarchaeota archaeon]|jgi:phosphonopyruvate decarboxylase/sulfopyruvate decarboxylase subunit beta|nr:MAG: sulfopyruvate decarboxylase subunit beta [Nitrososphaerota archaeon]
MIRKEAMKIVLEEIGNDPIISANGFISRDLFELNEKKTNFYMIGSMGLASSIGLGVAIKNPKKTIYVFDGDGNILMNLGSLTTIGTIKPKNFVHIIFDNHSHESTGGQPTNTRNISISNIGKVTNFHVFEINDINYLKKILKKIKKISGIIMIVIKINNSKIRSGRVTLDPVLIKNRFMESL